MQAYPMSQSLLLQYNIGCGRGMWRVWRDPIRRVKLEIQLRLIGDLSSLAWSSKKTAVRPDRLYARVCNTRSKRCARARSSSNHRGNIKMRGGLVVFKMLMVDRAALVDENWQMRYR